MADNLLFYPRFHRCTDCRGPQVGDWKDWETAKVWFVWRLFCFSTSTFIPFATSPISQNSNTVPSYLTSLSKSVPFYLTSLSNTVPFYSTSLSTSLCPISRRSRGQGDAGIYRRAELYCAVGGQSPSHGGSPGATQYYYEVRLTLSLSTHAPAPSPASSHSLSFATP